MTPLRRSIRPKTVSTIHSVICHQSRPWEAGHNNRFTPGRFYSVELFRFLRPGYLDSLPERPSQAGAADFIIAFVQPILPGRCPVSPNCLSTTHLHAEPDRLLPRSINSSNTSPPSVSGSDRLAGGK